MSTILVTVPGSEDEKSRDLRWAAHNEIVNWVMFDFTNALREVQQKYAYQLLGNPRELAHALAHKVSDRLLSSHRFSEKLVLQLAELVLRRAGVTRVDLLVGGDASVVIDGESVEWLPTLAEAVASGKGGEP